MRTTLKRGIGRGANGNGRAILPPGSLSPVTLYRQAPPPKPGFAKVVGRFFLFLALVLVVLVTGLVGGFYLWAHEKASALGCQTLDCKRASKRPRRDQRPEPTGDRAGHRLRPSRRRRRRSLALGHDDADPRRPRDEDDLAALAPARPRRPDLLPVTDGTGRNGPAVVYDHGRINSAYAFCGRDGLARDRSAPDGPADQLPDQRQLPRLHRGREQARRRLDGRRPPLLQRQLARPDRLRERSTSSRAISC